MASRIPLLADNQPIFRAGLRSLLEAQPGVEIVALSRSGRGGRAKG